MGKLADKLTKRIIAIALSLAMVMSNMTVYASEFSEPAAQTEEAVGDTETGSVELPSTEDEAVQDDTAQNEGTQDEGTQDEGDADEEKPQDEDTSDEGSDPENNEAGGDTSEPEESDEDGLEAGEADEDIQEAEDELEAEALSANIEVPTPLSGEPTLWLVGDSTVCAFTDNYYYPRYGYGTQIENYLDGTYTIENLAASGRSSKSYLTESKANYEKLTSGIKAGDVLVIGFGHNDEKNESARYTNPNGNYQEEGSFAKSLYDNYVKKALNVGAEVILCTPIVRRNDSGTLSASNCHITTDAVDENGNPCPGGDYPAAIRKLVTDAGGAESGVYLVDLTALTKELYTELGAEGTLYLHAWTGGLGVDETTGKDPGNPKTVDNTHLNIYGAKMVAWMFAKALSEMSADSAPDVASHVKSDIENLKPNQETDLVSNPEYKKPNYQVPTSGSTLFPSYTTGEGLTFQASVFGDIGGDSKVSTQYFTLGSDNDGNMQIEAKGQGKIASSTDGIAMYYYQIPSSKTFKISAKAKINSIDNTSSNSGQVAFGLMARDDMYIDLDSSSISSDYVVAGSTGAGTNCFYRKDGAIGGKGALSSGFVLEAGSEYDLCIEYNGDGYKCTFADQPSQSAGYDFQLTGVDSDYIYVGMFVARQANVTFSDIHLEIEEDPGDYNITITTDGNGTARSSKTTANAGDEITLTAVPKSGYAFKEWEVMSGDNFVSDITITDDKFIMPAGNVSIKAIFEELPITIDVWDFGGKEETDSRYANNITPDILKNSGSLATGGTYASSSTITYGDLKQVNGSGDKCYTNISSLSEYNSGTYAYAQYAYSDGYTAAGAYYCNGTGDSSKRYITIDNVKVGDKIVAYMGSSQSGDITFRFVGQGTASAQSDSGTVAAGEFKKFEFIAEYNGTYKIWADGSGKPMYHRVMRIPSAAVSGTIDLNDNYITSDYSVKFVNQTTKGETAAVLAEDGTFTAKLTPGYTYKAVLVGVTGYGFTNESATLSIVEDDIFTGKSGINLVIEYKDTYTFSGTIRGFDTNYALSNLEIIMTPENSSADDVELNISNNDGKLTFTSEIEQNMEYSFLMNGANDYKIFSPLVIDTGNEGTSYENRTIVVTKKPTYDIIGGFIGLDSSASVTALTFTNVEDNYSYTAVIENGGYSVNLRDGEYAASATVTGYTTNTHVVVNGGSVSKDLLFVSTESKGSLTKKSNIYVGYTDKDDNYATVKEAVEACERMNPTSEADRITVHIAPGTYREQVIINTPYISFVNDTDEEVLLTWYYGIGYKYYSADATGFYNPENAYDKYDKNIATKWGTAVYLKSGAKAFRAEGITFENSFNRYITDEEIEDGVEYTGESLKIQRYQGLDVTSKAATERASTIVIESDESEFLNCNFYSSQDTVMTKGAHTYFRNCVIEGQTDYICGAGSCVFDACELRWKGYSTGSDAGYLTASQAGESDKGYLFRNCTVTANSKLEVVAGVWGRPWSEYAAVVFMNTKLQDAGLMDGKSGVGWVEMSGRKPEDASFYEYNTTTIAGDLVDTSKRLSGTVMTSEEAVDINVTDYFGSWNPAYYTAEESTVVFAADPSVTDNGDINTPKAGNTLTVHYSLGTNNDANDASIIRWYTVEKESDGTEKTGSEKLVKISTATVDKTYKIEEGLVGKYIKVTVTPQTVSGAVGSAKSYTLDNAVAEGYEDPSNQYGDITLGDGINIFLAGDSTVKDYSAAGMYNNGSPLNEGSWGEFIQSFFDESEVKIQNYAQGGRSSRTFINEGKLAAIEENISSGDYLFIQFGHNDSSDTYPDRYVPLGTPDADGKYPTTAGVTNDGIYPDGGVGTFKWFLKQYIDVAKSKGAIPVLVTPVARMYYNADGTIRAHHDSSDTSNNAYVEAVKQLAEEEKVLLIDGYSLTEELFTEAWKADGNNSDVYGTQIMASGDKTHNNKLGGMIEAAAIASAIQKSGINISYAVKEPARVTGVTMDGKTVFSIDGNSKLTAYDINSDYAARASYWETVGQTMIEAIQSKADELAAEGPEGSVTAPTASPRAGEIEKGDTVTLSVPGADEGSVEIYYTTDGTSPKDNESAILYEEPIEINENTTIKAYAKEKVEEDATATLADSKVVTFEYTLLPSVKAPTLKSPAETTVKSGTVIKLETATTDAQIRYTMGSNPADPSVNSPMYSDTKGITITTATTVKAIAVKDGEKSSVAVFVFAIDESSSGSVTVAKPQSSEESGPLDLGDVIYLSTTTEAALIYYTTGTDPVDPTIRNADLYDDSEGIVINKNMTIKAIAVVGDSTSDIAKFTYTVPTTAAPTADAELGEVERNTKVSLTSDTEGAVIYYTTDRTDPKTSVTRIEYKDPIVIQRTITIKAYAVKDGYADSDVVTFNYTIPATKFTTAPSLSSTGGNIEAPHLGDVLTVNYVLDKEDEDVDASTIRWYRVDESEQEILLTADPDTNNKSYTIVEEDIGSIIRVEVTPNIAGGKSGEMKSAETGTVISDDGSKAGEGLQIVLDKTDKEYTYTGSAITPAIKVYYNGIKINEGTDYTVKYSNNIKVSTTSKLPTITVKGKGNFSGSATETFTIKAPSLKEAYEGDDLLISSALSMDSYDKENNELDLSAEQLEKIDAIMYVVEKTKLAPVMYYNGVKLTAKEYKLSKTDKWTADGEVTITGQTNFSNEADDALNIYVHVVKKTDLIKITKVDLTKSYDYDGSDTWSKQEPTIKVYAGKTPVEASNYVVTHTADTTNVGTVKVVVVGVGLYTGSVTKTYTIKPDKTGTNITITAGIQQEGYPFESTGTVLGSNDLKVVYKDGTESGKLLQENIDYKITYKSNKKVGTGKYSVTFLGNYKGTKTTNITNATGTFKIVAADLQKLSEDGRLKVVTVDKSFTKPGASYKSAPYVSIDDVLLKASNYTVNYYVGDSTTSTTNPKLSEEGTVSIEIVGKGNYTGTIKAVGEGENAKNIEYKVSKPTSTDYDLSKAVVTFKQGSTTVKKVEYTGEVIDEDTVTVVVMNKGKTQDISDKCTVEFVNNKNKGKATVVIKAKDGEAGGGYTGSKTASLTISAAKWTK